MEIKYPDVLNRYQNLQSFFYNKKIFGEGGIYIIIITINDISMIKRTRNKEMEA